MCNKTNPGYNSLFSPKDSLQFFFSPLDPSTMVGMQNGESSFPYIFSSFSSPSNQTTDLVFSSLPLPPTLSFHQSILPTEHTVRS